MTKLIPFEENEYRSLTARLLNSERLDIATVERLALTAGDNDAYAALDGEDIAAAERALTVLFACQRAAPQSVTVSGKLLEYAPDYIDQCGAEEEFAKAEACLARLCALLRSAPERCPVALACATSLVFLQSRYLDHKPGTLASLLGKLPLKNPAQKKYAALCKLALRYPDFPAMQAVRAWALGVWFDDATWRGDTGRADAWLGELREFADRQPENSLVAEQYRRICSRLLGRALDNDDLAGAERQFAGLRHLAAAHSTRHHAMAGDSPDYYFPHEADNFERACSQALVDFAVYHARHDDLAALQKCHVALLGLASTVRPESAAWFNDHKGALLSHLCLLHGNARQFTQAGQMLAQLQALADADPAHRSLRKSLAHALYNLAKNYGEDGLERHEREIAEKIAGLKTLSDAHPDEFEPRKMYASALYNLCGEQEAARRPSAATWELFYQFVLGHDVGSDLAESAAIEEKALIDRRKDLGAARVHWRRVRELARKYPRYEGVRAQLAGATFNMLVRHSAAGDFNGALEMYYLLGRLAESFPDDAEVALRLAKGALNMITDCGAAGRLNAAEDVYASLSAVAGRFSGDEKIASRLVKAARNLAVDYFNRKNYARVAELYHGARNLSAGPSAEADLDALKKMSALADFQ
ncbi:MAG: hypothetical protein LBD30_08915 [Verrucomicrobiales bacterium]|nr:hypothetical protein [Verrucomicrobiales bacterium]